jgi:hypothetical protein
VVVGPVVGSSGAVVRISQVILGTVIYVVTDNLFFPVVRASTSPSVCACVRVCAWICPCCVSCRVVPIPRPFVVAFKQQNIRHLIHPNPQTPKQPLPQRAKLLLRAQLCESVRDFLHLCREGLATFLREVIHTHTHTTHTHI